MFYLHHITNLRAFLVGLFTLGPANASPTAQDRLPAVWPPPQQISSSGGQVSLNGAVTIVTGNATDSATLDTVKAAVSSAGGEASVSSQPAGRGAQIVLGTGAENAAAEALAKALTGHSAEGLVDEGYVLASGSYEDQPSIVLNGVDTRGTFYASQTLRQLVDGHHVPGVKVRDWPLMSIRGSIEGFYGIPWSHQARLDQYAYYGKHKMNTYIYTPKDDPLLRAQWRKLYSGDALAKIKELVTVANTNHVDFTYALSPGLDLCYSSDADFNATVTKFNQVREFGVHSFYIAFDDIPLEFHCEADRKKWPRTDNYHWIADAQAYYLNRVQKEYIEPHGLKALETVPTNYYGSQPDPYKKELGTKLDDKIAIQWTGEGVFSPNITVDSAKRALDTYATENMFIWDNFPVNDALRCRLFLNPLEGRAPALYKYFLGFTSNPMIQPYASMPALANYADYTWNAPAYSPDASMGAALWELSGSDKHVHNALVAFADLSQNWPYRTPEVHSPMLSADITAFWAARNKSSSADGTNPLRARLDLLTTLPTVLPDMALKPFSTDVEPWSTVAMKWATACQHLVSMLDALDAGDKGRADAEFEAAMKWVEKTKAKTVDDRNSRGGDLPNSITPVVAKMTFNGFLGDATAVYKGQ
ncbi:beta-N-acetylglucosaminidase [Aspergillus sp. HF37]|nr:beta-N-acetylglucosaminidase [Aspergillus sp. HF37]